MKNQKGITLIALVITIIVLLILAAVSISAIVGEDGITNRAQDAKDKSAIATEKEQINLAYSACKVGNANTKEEGLKAPVEASELQTEMDKSYGTGKVSVSGESTNLLVQYLDSKRTYMIMQNGKVISDVSKVFNGSSTGPIGIAEDGSIVDMSNWRYQFFGDWNIDGEETGFYGLSINATAFSTGYIGEIVNGRIVGKVPAYILENPQGTSEEDYKNELVPVLSLDGTFSGLTELEYPPEIPSSVLSLTWTFAGCTNLKEAPVIPQGVTSLQRAFKGCQSLIKPPVIPNSVIEMYETFGDCINLEKAPSIPNSVTYLYYTFANCTKLTQAPEIPNSVTNMSNAFQGCTNLVTPPTSIPSSVKEMYYTFKDCEKLTGRMEINAKLDLSREYPKYSYEECFYNTSTVDGCSLVIVGSGTNDESIDILFDTKSANSNITIGS